MKRVKLRRRIIIRNKEHTSLALLTVIVFLLSILTLISGCAIFRPVDADKEELLISHLNSWKDFEIDGIVELNYRQLRFRKNILLKMSRDLLDVMIYDGGFFGLRPKPFATFKIDTSLVIDAPDNITELIDEQIDTDISINDFHKGLDLLHRNRNKIIRTGSYDFDSTRLKFNDRMQINKIEISKTDTVVSETVPNSSQDSDLELAKGLLSIVLEYDRHDKLRQVIFYREDRRLMSITVDSITN